MSEHRARRRRDASLSRVGKVTKGVVAASVAGAGALTLYVSRAFPGHQAGAAGSPLQTTTTTTATTAPPATSPVASAGSAPTTGEPTTLAPSTTVAPPTAIAPPTTAPTRTTAPPVVSSGAS
jgi:hypothetical protein